MCLAARSLVTSDSRSLTLSVSTADLFTSSRICESLMASSCLQRMRARCESSRSIPPEFRLGPPWLCREVLDLVGLVFVLEGAGCVLDKEGWAEDKGEETAGTGRGELLETQVWERSWRSSASLSSLSPCCTVWSTMRGEAGAGRGRTAQQCSFKHFVWKKPWQPEQVQMFLVRPSNLALHIAHIEVTEEVLRPS